MAEITPEEARRELLIKAQIELYRRQARWEPWKALAAIVAAGAVFAGGVLTVGSWWHPNPQTINIHLDKDS
jgi:hypothetical protein